MRRLWGRTSSVNVQKVLWALEELTLPYERVEAGGAHGVVDEAAYRAMNPNGLVPTWQEDDFVLWESNAILRYLAQRHGGVLALPADPRERAPTDQWLDWQATSFTPAMRDAFIQLVRTQPSGRDEHVVETSRRMTEAATALLDRHFAQTRFATGERFGIADIALGCAAHRWLHLPIAREERPHLQRWYDVIARRPAAAAVVNLPIG